MSREVVKLTKAVTFDESSGESVEAAIDHVGNDGEEEEEPRFGIEDCFDHLVTFKVTVDHTSLVPLNTGDGGEFFLVVEEPGSNG